MRIKKLDSSLVKGFIGPFFLATFIALFVLIMQTLWLYLDDILGKGANLFIVTEFLFYLSMSLVPMALPIGILLAAVMQFGSLGENYELSSMKSAGISLFRIMRPLIIFCIGVSIFSFLCNEYIIPYSNLKFKSRLYDLRKSRPTLKLEAGVFNDDFQGFVMYIGEKDKEGRHIKNVLIYDHKNTESKGQTNIIKAETGEMYASEDNNFFIMKLRNGNMYQEMDERNRDAAPSYPFLRSSFEEWTKIFDLREFDMNRTDEELFKSNQSMKNTSQLQRDIDSLDLRMKSLKESISEGMVYTLAPKNKGQPDELKRDSTEKENALVRDKVNSKLRNGNMTKIPSSTFVRDDSIGLASITHYYQAFKSEQRIGLLNRVKNEAEVGQQRLKNNQSALEKVKEKWVKHLYLLHSKFSFAVVCFVFLFIGAPMGAIVRKGGFGYPMLISIVFFILFILMNIFFKKLAESLEMDAILAAWLPILVLIPVGALLTYKAMNDSKIIDMDKIVDFFYKIFKIKSKA